MPIIPWTSPASREQLLQQVNKAPQEGQHCFAPASKTDH